MTLIAKAKDPAFWEKVRTSDAYRPLREELLALYEQTSADIPATKFSEFIVYQKTGSRSEYEHSYFYRRRAMNAAAILSLICPEEEKYLVRLCDVMWAILDEYTWVLPAHMPSFTENVVEHIDLFAAETGFALSEIDYLLEDRLPPLIRARVKAEVDRRILRAYLNNRYGWERASHNWAAVCVGSVAAAFLYQRPDLVPEILPRVQETLRSYLSGLPEDGTCLEGYGYWCYGFGFFTVIADLLHDFTDGKIDYFADPHVKKIAAFPQSVFLDGATTVSFADAGGRGSYPLGLLHYLSAKYPDAVQIPANAPWHTYDGCGRWCAHLRSFLWFDETLAAAEAVPFRDEYRPDAQWLIRTTPHYAFAAKGGHNAEPHNHNDVGSFIVACGGQILRDPGSGAYTRAYFSSRRYDFFRPSSRGHSVPIINGTYQSAGRERSADAAYENGVLTLEMHRAYDVPALSRLTRAFSFTDDTVTLTDTYVYDGTPSSLVERIVCAAEPQPTPDGFRVGPLTLTADASVAAAEIRQEDNSFLIDYTLKPDARVFTLTVTAE